MANQPETKAARIRRAFEDHPLWSWVIVAFAVLLALGQLIGAWSPVFRTRPTEVLASPGPAVPAIHVDKPENPPRSSPPIGESAGCKYILLPPLNSVLDYEMLSKDVMDLDFLLKDSKATHHSFLQAVGMQSIVTVKYYDEGIDYPAALLLSSAASSGARTLLGGWRSVVRFSTEQFYVLKASAPYLELFTSPSEIPSTATFSVEPISSNEFKRITNSLLSPISYGGSVDCEKAPAGVSF